MSGTCCEAPEIEEKVTNKERKNNNKHCGITNKKTLKFMQIRSKQKLDTGREIIKQKKNTSDVIKL